MIIIRGNQPIVTNVTPHNSNKEFIVIRPAPEPAPASPAPPVVPNNNNPGGNQ